MGLKTVTQIQKTRCLEISKHRVCNTDNLSLIFNQVLARHFGRLLQAHDVQDARGHVG